MLKRKLNSFSVAGVMDYGFIDGKWTIKYKDYGEIEHIETIVFDKGKLLSCKTVNTETGNAKSPISDQYKNLIFGPETEQGTKSALYNYFRTIHRDLARAFQLWMGDPTLESYDNFTFYNKENHSGFAYEPKK